MPSILGVNPRYYPREGALHDPIEVRVVLTAVQVGDYAAYIGCGSAEFVAQWGNKLSFDEAKCHFPHIEEGKYRP